MGQNFTEVKKQLKYRHLLGLLIVNNIKTKYRRSILGVLWTILNPLLSMVVLTFVFSQIFTSVENYPLYLMTGSVLFTFNTEATNQCLHSILANGGLITKVYVPKILFPVSAVLSGLVNLGFSLVALFVVALVLQLQFTAAVLMFFVMLPSLILFSTGVGLILSALNVFFRDINHLYGIFTTLWMYLTPIFYPIEQMSIEVQNIIKLNPLFHFIDYFRSVLISGVVPDFSQFGLCYGIGVAFLIFGLGIFNKLKNKFILHI